MSWETELTQVMKKQCEGWGQVWARWALDICRLPCGVCMSIVGGPRRGEICWMPSYSLSGGRQKSERSRRKNKETLVLHDNVSSNCLHCSSAHLYVIAERSTSKVPRLQMKELKWKGMRQDGCIMTCFDRLASQSWARSSIQNVWKLLLTLDNEREPCLCKGRKLKELSQLPLTCGSAGVTSFKPIMPWVTEIVDPGLCGRVSAEPALPLVKHPKAMSRREWASIIHFLSGGSHNVIISFRKRHHP